MPPACRLFHVLRLVHLPQLLRRLRQQPLLSCGVPLQGRRERRRERVDPLSRAERHPHHLLPWHLFLVTSSFATAIAIAATTAIAIAIAAAARELSLRSRAQTLHPRPLALGRSRSSLLAFALRLRLRLAPTLLQLCNLVDLVELLQRARSATGLALASLASHHHRRCTARHRSGQRLARSPARAAPRRTTPGPAHVRTSHAHSEQRRRGHGLGASQCRFRHHFRRRLAGGGRGGGEDAAGGSCWSR